MIFSSCLEQCMLQKVSKVQSSYYIHLSRVYTRFRLDLELHDMITKRVGKLYIIFIFIIENEGLYSC